MASGSPGASTSGSAHTFTSPSATPSRRKSSYIPLSSLRQAASHRQQGKAGSHAAAAAEEEEDDIVVNTLEGFSSASAASPAAVVPGVSSLEAVQEVVNEGEEGEGGKEDAVLEGKQSHDIAEAPVDGGSDTAASTGSNPEKEVVHSNDRIVSPTLKADVVTKDTGTQGGGDPGSAPPPPSFASPSGPSTRPRSFSNTSAGSTDANDMNSRRFNVALAGLQQLGHVETIAGVPWWLWSVNQARIAVAVATEEGNTLRRLVHAHNRVQRAVPLAVLPSLQRTPSSYAAPVLVPIPLSPGTQEGAPTAFLSAPSLFTSADLSGIDGGPRAPASPSTPALPSSSAATATPTAVTSNSATSTFFSCATWVRHLATWLDAPTLTTCRAVNKTCQRAVDDVAVWAECALNGGMRGVRRQWWAWVMGLSASRPPSWAYVAHTRGLRTASTARLSPEEALMSPRRRRVSFNANAATAEVKTAEGSAKASALRGWVKDVDVCMSGEWPVLSAMAEAEAERASSQVVTSAEREEWQWVKELEQDVERTTAPTLQAMGVRRRGSSYHSGSDADDNSEEEGEEQWQQLVGKENIRQLVFVLVLTNAELHFTQVCSPQRDEPWLFYHHSTFGFAVPSLFC